jgi:hypothetical protein
MISFSAAMRRDARWQDSSAHQIEGFVAFKTCRALTRDDSQLDADTREPLNVDSGRQSRANTGVRRRLGEQVKSTGPGREGMRKYRSCLDGAPWSRVALKLL